MEEQILIELKKQTECSLLAVKSLLTIEDVAMLTGLTKYTLYKMTSTKQIPHYKPNGRNVFFEKKDVEAWMRSNRIDSVEEIEQKALSHMN